MDTQELSYEQAQRRELAALIEAIELPELNRRYLLQRWLDQLLWAEGRATHARNRHYVLRVMAIVGGVIVPALVSLTVQGAIQSVISWTTFAVSLAVAIALALENFFRWGERWTHYRRLAELLKSEGWLYLQLGNPYADLGTHARAYPEFVKRVESLLGADVDVFIAQVARDKGKAAEGAAEEKK